MGRIRAAIWENDTQNGKRCNVSITRIYRDGNDKWQDTTSFGRDDLLLVKKVADAAHTWILENSVSNTEAEHETASA